MTNVVLSREEEAAIEAMADSLTRDVYAAVQAELEQLDWTEDLDSTDWAQLQADVVGRIK